MPPNLHTNLHHSQITEMITTASPLGSFAGPQQPNLQIDHLEPGEYTLQFQIVEPPNDPFPFSTYAIARWKVRGQQIQRIISVFSGAVLGGVAEAVDVQLLDQSNRSLAGHFAPILAITVPGSNLVTLAAPGPATINIPQNATIYFNSQLGVGYSPVLPVIGGVPGTVFQLTTVYTGPPSPPLGGPFWIQSPYKVAVGLSKGTRPPIQQPPVLLTAEDPITVKAGVVGPVGGLAIPQDAGVISVITSVIPTSAPGVPLTSAANGAVFFVTPTGAIGHGYIPGAPQNFYPVPPGSTRIFFANCDAAQDLDFTFQWGIEG